MNQALSSNLSHLLSAMAPLLHEGTFAYCVLAQGSDISALSPVLTMAEPEGLTLVLPEQQAVDARLTLVFRAAWITLSVHSDLQAVGLTAAFASALARAGLSCNVVAGAFHDHIFVPVEQAQSAMATLRALQQDALRQQASVLKED